jgi:hypothetical protein
MLGKAVLAVVHNTYVRTNTSKRLKVQVPFIIRTVSLRGVAKLINNNNLFYSSLQWQPIVTVFNIS